jgi:hypothetical protein
VPRYAADVPYMGSRHDLTYAALEAWDRAGIAYKNYIIGDGGDPFMIRDGDRYQEARDIAYRTQWELEQHVEEK